MSSSPLRAAEQSDIRTPADVHRMVETFYEQVLKDEVLGQIFLVDAGIRLEEHKPRIRAFWEKLLLGMPGYDRHTMNIHRALHAHRPLTQSDFARWVSLFQANVDRHFAGPKAERAKRLAANIASNMKNLLGVRPCSSCAGAYSSKSSSS